MNNFRRVAAILLMTLLALGCSGGSTVAEEIQPMGTAELKQFLTDNAGKPTMLIFWATWCPSCKEVLPDMAQLAKSHGDKVNVISVSLDDNKGAIESYLKGKDFGLPVYHGDHEVAALFGVQAIPTMVFFNKAGDPVFAKPGGFPYDMLKAMAEKLMAE